MDSFAVIGLMLSLFGGTYASLSAIKSWCDPFVDKFKSQRAVAMAELERFPERKHTQDTGKRYDSLLRLSCIVYHVAQAAPIFAFTGFSFWMCLWTLNHWGTPIPDTDAAWWKGLIFWSMMVAVSCLGLVLLALIAAAVFGWLLDRHCKTAMEGAAGSVQKASPTVVSSAG